MTDRIFALTCALAGAALLGLLAAMALHGDISPAAALALALALGAAGLALAGVHRRLVNDARRETAQARDQARELAREQARQVQPLRAKILRGIADPLLLIDDRRLVVEANRAAIELLDADPTGQDIALFLRQPAILDAIRQSAQSGQPVERQVALAKPLERHFQARVNMIVNELDADLAADAPAFHQVVSLHDVTQVILADRMRVDFVANASHELRTPLASLSGFIETLQDAARDDADARARFLEIMGAEARRMSRVIDDLLSLSRIERDKFVRPEGAVALEPLLRGIAKSMAMTLEAGGRRLDIETDADLPPVLADADQIVQVLQNLVTNSIKYGRAGTAISLTARRARGGVEIAVADEGEGIEPHHIPRLTERFYRVDAARSRALGGTGLGLAIVKHIVERHRSELKIASTPGKGTTVSFVLPVDSGQG